VFFAYKMLLVLFLLVKPARTNVASEFLGWRVIVVGGDNFFQKGIAIAIIGLQE